MRGSTRKYFKEQGGVAHNGQLSWPGTLDGYPFRGTPPQLTRDQFDDIPIVWDFHSRLFDLRTDDKKDFDEIMDRVHTGWFHVVNRYDHWQTEPPGLLVWLEWVQGYGEAPTTA